MTLVPDEQHSIRCHAPGQGSPIRLAAIDDHPLILTGLHTELVRGAPDIKLVDVAPTVDQLLARKPAADVVLLDLHLGDDSTPAANIVALQKAGCRVLVHAGDYVHRQVEEALAAGADGSFSKSCAPDTLIEAIRAVARGWPSGGSKALSGPPARIPTIRPPLSPRELETIALYASGLPMKSVARRLDVGIETVREYLKRIRKKYASLQRPAGTRMEMYQRAIEDGIIQPTDSWQCMIADQATRPPCPSVEDGKPRNTSHLSSEKTGPPSAT